MFDIEQCNDLLKEDTLNLGEDFIYGKISQSEFNKLSSDIKSAYNTAYSNFRRHKQEHNFLNQIKINLKSIFHVGKF